MRLVDGSWREGHFVGMVTAKTASWVLAAILVGSWAWFLSRPEPKPAVRKPDARGRMTDALPQPTGYAGQATDDGVPAVKFEAGSPRPGAAAATAGFLQNLLQLSPQQMADEFSRLQVSQRGRSGFSTTGDTDGVTREDPLMRLLLGHWGEIAPQDALAAIAAVSDREITPSERAKFVDFILEGWVTNEPREAMAWALNSVSGLTAEEQRASAGTRLYSMVAALVESGKPDVAAALLQEIPPNEIWNTYAQQNFYRPLALKWGETDPMAAATWALSLPNSVGRTGVITGLAQAAADAGPDNASRFISSLTRDADIRNAIGGVMISYGLRGDGQGAFNWLQAAAAQGNANGRYDLGIRNYFNQKGIAPLSAPPDQERALLAQISNPSIRTTAANQYVARRTATMPEEAVTAIMQYYEPARQQTGLSNVVRVWAERDYPAAQAYVNGSTLIPDVLREALLSTAAAARKK